MWIFLIIAYFWTVTIWVPHQLNICKYNKCQKFDFQDNCLHTLQALWNLLVHLNNVGDNRNIFWSFVTQFL